MRVVVIYESIYGNTGAVAAAIAEGIESDADVLCMAVPDILPNADMYVFGAPTHVHGLSSTMSRKSIEDEVRQAVARGEPLHYFPTAGMRMLIEDLPSVSGTPVAVFDTRFHKSRILTGSAAKTMAKKLERKGYEVVVAPESFFVVDTDGPLADGEMARARAWGATVARTLLSAQSTV